MWEISVPPSQFCCSPKTALKNKVNVFTKKQKENSQNLRLRKYYSSTSQVEVQASKRKCFQGCQLAVVYDRAGYCEILSVRCYVQAGGLTVVHIIFILISSSHFLITCQFVLWKPSGRYYFILQHIWRLKIQIIDQIKEVNPGLGF